MTPREFHNALRVLMNIDADEFYAAVHPEIPNARIDAKNPQHTVPYQDWCSFSRDPYRWFVRASDDDAKAIWSIIEARQRP